MRWRRCSASRQKAAEIERRTLFEGVADTLAELKARGLKLAVLSDTESQEARVRRRLAELGIEQHFDAVLTSIDIGHVKPQPEAFAAALTRLAIPAAEAAFVGHDADELDGARQSGLVAVAFNHEDGVVADYYIEHFRDLLQLPLGGSREPGAAIVMMSIDSAATPPEVAMEAPSAFAPRRASIVYLAGALAGGNVISAVLRTVGGLLQARFVTVPMMGLYVTLSLALEYALMAQLGVFNGLNRELPYVTGKGDHARGKELAAATQAWAILISSLVALVMLALAVWSALQGDMWRVVGWGSNAILAYFWFYSGQSLSYLQVTYRTGHDFARLALVGVVQNALGLVLVVLVVFFNFYGMCFRLLITFTVAGILLYYWRPVRVGPKWNTAHLKHLMIVGLPIYGVGMLYYWWTVLLSKTLVGACMGEDSLGLYGMVVMAVGMVELLPGAVTQVVYPRMAELYGRTGTVHGLLGMTVKPILLTAVGMIPIILVACWLVGPAMRLVLPQFADAVPAMRWALLVPWFSSFNSINNVFNVVRRQDLYVIAILLGLAAYGGCLAWLLRGGVTLVAFPQAMLVGQAVFIVCCYVLAVYLVRKEHAVT